MTQTNAENEQEGQRVLLLVSYDGGHYSGFARQTNAVTVADTLQAAIHEIDPGASLLTCASRTDAGVHARSQPVSFVAQRTMTSRGWVLALAQRLPPSITIVRASRVAHDFDPRRDPLWKRYRYRVLCSQVEDPFLSPISWRIGNSLDLELMRAEARSLEGTHDFAAFRHIDDHRKVTERTMHSIQVEEAEHRSLHIVVVGNRFMYNMVRIIAGTLVDVGRGKQRPGAGQRAIESGNRRDLGMTAPPHGLMLEHVELRTSGSDPWPPCVE